MTKEIAATASNPFDRSSVRVIAESSTAEPLLVSVDAASEMLGLGRSTVWAMLARGDLPSKQIGRRRLIPVAAIKRLAGIPEAA